MSASCRDALRLLPALAAGEPDVAPAVREHVAGCAACSQRVEHARRLAAALRSLPRMTMPAAVGAAEALGAAVPVRDQDRLGSALAAALPRLQLPELSGATPSTNADTVSGDTASGLRTGIGPVLRVALRAPGRTPGWLWTRVRADLSELRAESLEQVQVEHASRVERSLQRWFHSGLAAAAALVLAVWFSSTMQAKVPEDPEPLVIHLEPQPLVIDQLPEAFHDSMVPEVAVTPRPGGGR